MQEGEAMFSLSKEDGASTLNAVQTQTYSMPKNTAGASIKGFLQLKNHSQNLSKDAVWYSLVICAALAEATNISVVNENEKNFKKLLVKNKAKLINSLLEHGWGRTGKAQETILVLNKKG